MKPSEIDEIERRTDRIPYASIGAERILKLIAHVRRLDKELLELRAENERLKAKVLLGDDLAEAVNPIFNDYILIGEQAKNLVEALEKYKSIGSRRDEA